jgi:hypothetical protein
MGKSPFTWNDRAGQTVAQNYYTESIVTQASWFSLRGRHECCCSLAKVSLPSQGFLNQTCSGLIAFKKSRFSVCDNRSVILKAMLK